MKVCRITSDEYAALFKAPSHLYNSVAFNLLNAPKCDDLHFLSIVDDNGKVRFGIILGERTGVLKSPFSAPFGGLEANSTQRTSHYLEAVESLRAYGALLNKNIIITLPPFVRSDSHLSKTLTSICSTGGHIDYIDYNFHYPLAQFKDYMSGLRANARRNLKASLRNGFEFHSIDSADSATISEIYRIVHTNHTSLGYPVHMSLDDIIATSRIIPIDFFIVTREGHGIASAIIYRPADGIAQLIYWGDLPEARPLRPMDFLAFKVMEYYYNQGLAIYDLGPSSSDGIPALGLCDFKEGLGCIATPKYTLEV